MPQLERMSEQVRTLAGTWLSRVHGTEANHDNFFFNFLPIVALEQLAIFSIDALDLSKGGKRNE
jgi:hypothetical protein